MATKPLDDDFDASWFYELATLAAIFFSWREVVELFAGETVTGRCIAAWIMFQIAGVKFGEFVNGFHAWFVKRLGPLVGVVTTMLIVFAVVRGSLMIAVQGSVDPGDRQNSPDKSPTVRILSHREHRYASFPSAACQHVLFEV